MVALKRESEIFKIKRGLRSSMPTEDDLKPSMLDCGPMHFEMQMKQSSTHPFPGRIQHH
jgi:hypothetical protein